MSFYISYKAIRRQYEKLRVYSVYIILNVILGFPVGSLVKKYSPTNAGDTGLIPGLGRFPGEMAEMATHSHILAWEIPWTEEPDGL